MESFDLEMSARRGRRSHMGLQMITAAEALQLENSVRKKDAYAIAKPYIPTILWMIWMVVGCSFYALYNDYDVSRGFYMSVNIGWGMNWTLDNSFDSINFDDTLFRLVSIVFTSAGTFFLGFSAIYISKILAGKKDEWFHGAGDKASEETYSVLQYFPTQFRVLCLFGLWFLVGIFLFWGIQPSWSLANALSYVLSTLTGAGYKSLDEESTTWQFALAALYCTVGVPLMALTIGLSASSLFEPSQDDLLTRLVADVTDEEIDFMVEFGIIDDDGKVDKSEFLVLMAVRIGKASIQLLSTIHDRFRELDRKKMKKILLDDIVEGRQKVTQEMRKAMFARVGLNSVTMSSFADIETELQRISHKERHQEFVDRGNLFEDHADSSSSSSSSTSKPESEEDSPCPLAEGPTGIDFMPASRSTFGNGECTKRGIDPDGETGDTAPSEPMRAAAMTDVAEQPLPPDKSAKSSLMSKRGMSTLSIRTDSNIQQDSFDCEALPAPTGEDIRDAAAPTAPKSLQTVIENLRETALKKHASSKTPMFFRQASMDDDMELPTHLPTLRNTGFSNVSYRSDFARTPSGLPALFAPRLGRDASTQSLGSLPPTSPALKRMVSMNSVIMNTEVYPVHICGYYCGDLESKKAILLYKCFVHPYFRLLCFWLAWVLCGILFYTLHEDAVARQTHSWPRGLFVSTSVGAGMFWMVGDNKVGVSGGVRLFTVMYMLTGSLVTGCIRAAVAYSIADAKGQWYAYALKRKEFLAESARADFKSYTKAAIAFYGPSAFIHIVLVVFICGGLVFACAHFGFSFLDGLYFSISTLAAGGFKAIPDNVQEFDYAFLGMFILLGAPIMAASLSILAQYVVDSGRHDTLDEVMHMVITEQEISTLIKSGIDNSDGYIDMSEYTVLILLRIGAISPDLIYVVNEWFDDSGAGDSCTEITFEQMKKIHITADTPMRKRVNNFISG